MKTMIHLDLWLLWNIWCRVISRNYRYFVFLWSPVILTPDSYMVPLVVSIRSSRNILPLKYISLWYREELRCWSVNAKLLRV